MGTVVIDMQPNVQQIYDTLIAARPDYLMSVNAQGQIRFASDACQDLLGLSGASLEQRTFDSLLVADDRHSYQHFMRETIMPLAGRSFSKLGPVDLRVKVSGEADPEVPPRAVPGARREQASHVLARVAFDEGVVEAVAAFHAAIQQDGRPRRHGQ